MKPRKVSTPTIDATLETNIGNRSIPNEFLHDGREIVSRSGTEYFLKLTKTKPIEDNPSRSVSAYDVVRKSNNQTIGTITSYTTESRLFSLLERKENPKAMQPVEFIGKISGSPTMIYIVVRHEREWANIRLDDCFDIEITKKDGSSFEDINHHLSLNKVTPVINISRMKRIMKEKDPEGKQQFLTVAAYRKLTEKERNQTLALLPGDIVKVKLTPAPNWQEFFFADNI